MQTVDEFTCVACGRLTKWGEDRWAGFYHTVGVGTQCGECVDLYGHAKSTVHVIAKSSEPYRYTEMGGNLAKREGLTPKQQEARYEKIIAEKAAMFQRIQRERGLSRTKDDNTELTCSIPREEYLAAVRSFGHEAVHNNAKEFWKRQGRYFGRE